MDREELTLLAKALDFAAIKHRNQRRKNGDIPYINHPLGVMRVLCEDGGVHDTATIVAAILHDTIEDTATTKDELTEQFGAKIAGIVAEVTDDKSLSKLERKRLQIDHAAHISTEARIVKLGDKLHNLRDLASNPPAGWTSEQIQGYFCWAYHVVQAAGPVNERLGQALDVLFTSEFTHAGESYRALPAGDADRAALLQRYFAEMERVAN